MYSIVGVRIFIKPEAFAEYDGDSYELWSYEGPHWEEELYHKLHELKESDTYNDYRIQVKKEVSVSCDGVRAFIWMSYSPPVDITL